MNPSKTIFLLIALLTITITSSAICEEPQQTNQTLQFETDNDTPWNMAKHQIRSLHMNPQYGAELLFDTPKKFFSRRSNHSATQADKGLSEAIFKSLSREQISLLNNRSFGITHTVDSNNICKLTIYTEAEDDIKLIAKAIVNWWKNQAAENLLNAKSQLKYYNPKKTELETEIEKYNTEKENTDAELKKISEMVRYQNKEEAKESAKNLNKTIQSLEIEIAGLQAKLEVMKKQAKRYGVNNPLEEMRMKLEIDLAGALAKKTAALQSHKYSVDFSCKTQKIKIIKDLLKDKEKELDKILDQIKRYESELNSTHTKPLQLIENKITIHPIVYPNK